VSYDSETEVERTPPRGKVISLQGHQAAEQVLDDLSRATRHSRDYGRLVRKAADLGLPMLAATVRHLDSSHPTRLAILGDILLAYSPQAEGLDTLARAATDRRNSDNRRMGAIILLCNYYPHLPVSEDFLSGLRNPIGTAAHALVSVLGECAGDPELLTGNTGFLAALLSQPVDILYAALNRIADMPDEGAVPALRLLALHPHPDLMEAAVEALGARVSVSAIRSLTMLEPNLPGEPAHVASRLLHKIRLSGLYGAEFAPQTEHAARAILSAVDGRGRRMLWLHVPPTSAVSRPVFMGLLMSDYAGLIELVGPTARSTDAVSRPPTPGPVGTLYPPMVYKLPDIPANLATVSCVEVPYGYGLRLLRKAVSRNWLTGTPLPLEYQLLFNLIWQFGQGNGDEESYVTRFVERDDRSLAESESESELLANSLFDSWYLESAGVRLVAEELAALDYDFSHELTEDNWRILLPSIIRLAHDEFGPELRMRYANRLRLMSEWLRFSDQHHDADLAASAAYTIVNSPPEANLFVLRLVQKGILVALSELTFDLR
jgi:hypothetical protein